MAAKRLPEVGQGRIEEEPGMSQQEDMVAQDAGHDDETGSYVAVSPAADDAWRVEDSG